MFPEGQRPCWFPESKLERLFENTQGRWGKAKQQRWWKEQERRRGSGKHVAVYCRDSSAQRHQPPTEGPRVIWYPSHEKENTFLYLSYQSTETLGLYFLIFLISVLVRVTAPVTKQHDQKQTRKKRFMWLTLPHCSLQSKEIGIGNQARQEPGGRNRCRG